MYEFKYKCDPKTPLSFMFACFLDTSNIHLSAFPLSCSYALLCLRCVQFSPFCFFYVICRCSKFAVALEMSALDCRLSFCTGHVYNSKQPHKKNTTNNNFLQGRSIGLSTNSSNKTTNKKKWEKMNYDYCHAKEQAKCQSDIF